MTFLPEEDQEFLDDNGVAYELKTEKLPDGTERNAILFPAFAVNGNLRAQVEGQPVMPSTCELLILMPIGYATTKLDSFYTSPHLKRPDGTDPDRATGPVDLFGKPWQFWSRHLEDSDWRVGIDGLRTYLSYIRAELRSA
jgi:Prokaryotic E2 family E